MTQTQQIWALISKVEELRDKAIVDIYKVNNNAKEYFVAQSVAYDKVLFLLEKLR